MYFHVPPKRDPDPEPEVQPPSPPAPEAVAEQPAPPPAPEVAVERSTLPAGGVSPPATRGSFRLFRLAGTDVYVHWSWFVVAYFLIRDRPIPYSSLTWDATEYVAGFGLILLHEFGHVLACRQVGGAANRVVLWPLGGLAFVAPPPRPVASLWTTAAGPLVNLVLAPVLFLLVVLTAPAADDEPATDLYHLFWSLNWFNLVVLVFNLFPIFPLDGGRILQAVLWPWLGRSTALAVAALIGVLAGAGLGVLAVVLGDRWLVALALFLVLGALGGLAHSHRLAQMGQAERRPEVTCPTCGSAPPVGEFWRCTRCFRMFDLFAPAGYCPKGGSHETDVSCPECGRYLAPGEWVSHGPVGSDQPPPQ